MFQKIALWVLFLSLSMHQLIAQNEPKVASEGKAPGIILLDLAYAMQLPEGDMKENFGMNLNLGTRVGYLTPSNWIFSISADALFAEVVKTDVLKPLRESNGFIIDRNGGYALTQLGERGFYLGGQVGHLFDLGKVSRRHSLELRFGAGYLQHWIRIRLLGAPEDLVQLYGPYLRGYDRRTSGPALQQYIGYRFMSKSKLINAFAGFDFTEGFTKNRRAWNFDTQSADTKNRLDILMGFRIGFTLPFFIYTENTRIEDIKFY